jgi:chemotaxis receptor (MCP) glutamine deamidase CheD
MEKVMLPVFKADILQAISKFPKKDLESLLREIEELARTERKVTAKFVGAQELNMLSGLISIGGDALEDSERLYD